MASGFTAIQLQSQSFVLERALTVASASMNSCVLVGHLKCENRKNPVASNGDTNPLLLTVFAHWTLQWTLRMLLG